jgi:hypothetical protein
MSGVNVIRYLLANAAAVTAVVPATRIKAGIVPLGTELPAISVRQISNTPMHLLCINEPGKMHMERVQVTVIHNTYLGLKTTMKLLLAACPSQRGTVNGIVVDSIVSQSEGPDLFDDAALTHACSRDFLVKYIE